MTQNFVLHHVPNRAVSYNNKNHPYAIISIPKSFKQPLRIMCGTHVAHILCYQIGGCGGQTYCKIALFQVGKASLYSPSDVNMLHAAVVKVSVTKTNLFVKIPPVIIDAMTNRKSTHCVDWTCLKDMTAFGIVRTR